VLGLSLGLAPIGAWIAVTGRVGLPSLVLGVAVVFWVAGAFHAITVCCLALAWGCSWRRWETFSSPNSGAGPDSSGPARVSGFSSARNW
jgi:hypothetical protein